jgi:hypothetical protein
MHSEAINDAVAGARTPMHAFSVAEGFLNLAESGFIPGEATNDAKAGARTPIR